MSAKKVLVCGGTGFIGRNMIAYLQDKPEYEVYATYLTSKPPESGADGRARWLAADLRLAADVERVVRGMDIVIQGAATTSGAKDTVHKPYYHVTDNAIMNSLIFRAAHEQSVKHVVFFSCTTMYPETGKPVRETDFNYQVIDRYFGVGWTKVYIEKMCEFYSRLGRTRFTAIRHSNIYGPHDKYDLERSHVFGATVTKVMTTPEGAALVVWGDGSEERDLLYIDDLVDFVAIALKKQAKPFDLINVGLGKAISVRELVEKLILHAGRRIRVEYDASKPSIPFKLALNTDHAKNDYGWAPKIGLDEGIKKTLAWYTKYFAAKQPG